MSDASKMWQRRREAEREGQGKQGKGREDRDNLGVATTRLNYPWRRCYDKIRLFTPGGARRSYDDSAQLSEAALVTTGSPH